MDRILVVAGNWQQYKNFCHDNNIKDIKQAQYVYNLWGLHGTNKDIVFTGTYMDRKDMPEILSYVYARGLIIVSKNWITT